MLDKNDGRMRKKIANDAKHAMAKAIQEGRTSRDMMAFVEDKSKALMFMDRHKLSGNEYGFKEYEHPDKGPGYIVGPKWMLDDKNFKNYVALFMAACPREIPKQECNT